MHEDVQLSRQLERMKNWKDPIVDAVAAVILKRPTTRTEGISTFNTFEFLVTERLRGAAKGHHQVHHGGFIKPTDPSVEHSAVREVREETGFVISPEQLMFVGRFGPELYRSYVRWDRDETLVLEISNDQAEPGILFVLDLFLAVVATDATRVPTDKEVREVGWFTLDELTGRYGRSKTFNYWGASSVGRSISSTGGTGPSSIRQHPAHT